MSTDIPREADEAEAADRQRPASGEASTYTFIDGLAILVLVVVFLAGPVQFLGALIWPVGILLAIVAVWVALMAVGAVIALPAMAVQRVFLAPVQRIKDALGEGWFTALRIVIAVCGPVLVAKILSELP